MAIAANASANGITRTCSHACAPVNLPVAVSTGEPRKSSSRCRWAPKRRSCRPVHEDRQGKEHDAEHAWRWQDPDRLRCRHRMQATTPAGSTQTPRRRTGRPRRETPPLAPCCCPRQSGQAACRRPASCGRVFSWCTSHRHGYEERNAWQTKAGASHSLERKTQQGKGQAWKHDTRGLSTRRADVLTFPCLGMASGGVTGCACDSASPPPGTPSDLARRLASGLQLRSAS